MIWIVARKVWLTSITDLWFVVGSVLCIVTAVALALMFRVQWQLDVDTYGKMQALSEKQADLDSVTIVRRPEPLAFLRKADEALPRYLIVLPDFTDFPTEDVGSRSFLEKVESLDWASIIVYPFAFLVLVLGAVAISGEKERRTLPLLLSTGLSRAALVIGSYVGIMLALIYVLLMAFLLHLLIVNPTLSSAEWMRVIVAFALSMLFLSVVAWLALWTSTLSHHAQVSLLIGFLAWFLISVVVPQGASLLSQQLAPVPSMREYHAQLSSAEKAFSARTTVSLELLLPILIGPGRNWSEAEKQRYLQQAQEKLFKEHEAALADYKAAVYKIRQHYLSRLTQQMETTRSLMRLSPAGCYWQAMEGIAGTGYWRMLRFYQTAEQYREAYSEFARKWRAALRSHARISGAAVSEGKYRLQGVSSISYRGVDFPRELLPKFQERVSARSDWNGLFLNLSLLIGFNALFFALALAGSLRYDPR